MRRARREPSASHRHDHNQHMARPRFRSEYGSGLTGLHGPDYRENLCHYCRIVAFWAPLEWTFCAGVAGTWYATPATLFGVGASIVVAALGLWAALVLTIWLAALGLLYGGVSYATSRQHRDKVEAWLDAHRGYFAIALGACVATLVGYWVYEFVVHPIYLLWAGIGVVGGLVIAFVIGLVVVTIQNRREEREFRGDSAHTVAYEYLRAHHDKVCPYIDVEDHNAA